MSNSKLVCYTKLSPYTYGKRNHAIDTISIHCMAGNLSVESCGQMFQTSKSSSNSAATGASACTLRKDTRAGAHPTGATTTAL